MEEEIIERKLEALTIVCRVGVESSTVPCDYYTDTGKYLGTKEIPREELKEVIKKQF